MQIQRQHHGRVGISSAGTMPYSLIRRFSAALPSSSGVPRVFSHWFSRLMLVALVR
jgi:hypothetical protein